MKSHTIIGVLFRIVWLTIDGSDGFYSINQGHPFF